jgi:phosphate transport system substrate-binding protein
MNRPHEVTGKAGRILKALSHGAPRCALLVFLVAGLGCSLSEGLGGQEQTSGAEAELRGKLVLSGSSTMAPLMVAVGQRFSERHPGVRIEVHTGGSGRGIRDARRGAVDIGMASRALNDQERDLVGLPIARRRLSAGPSG